MSASHFVSSLEKAAAASAEVRRRAIEQAAAKGNQLLAEAREQIEAAVAKLSSQREIHVNLKELTHAQRQQLVKEISSAKGLSAKISEGSGYDTAGCPQHFIKIWLSDFMTPGDASYTM